MAEAEESSTDENHRKSKGLVAIFLESQVLIHPRKLTWTQNDGLEKVPLKYGQFWYMLDFWGVNDGIN